MNNFKELIAYFLITLVQLSSSIEKEMTVNVEPGKRHCFFQPAKLGEVIDIEYQVIDGGHGDLDINFDFSEPSGLVIFLDRKKSENMHRHEVRVDGDYQFCFDNTISSFNSKTIFFEMIIDNDGEENNENDWKSDILEGLTPNEFIDMKIGDFQESMGRIRTHLSRARQLQDYLRSNEARDRNMAEENYFKVNIWSMFQIVLMLAVGGIQVIMVRSLFDPNSKVHKVWTKLS